MALICKHSAFGVFTLGSNIFIYDWYAGVFTPITLPTGINVADGNWHHIAKAFNSGVVNGTSIYVDGSKVYTGTYTVGNNSRPLVLGCDINFDNNNSLDAKYYGYLSNFRIWSTVRTEQQINSSKNLYFVNNNEEGLLGSYFFG